ncbi:hypothetical protein AB0D12_31100 [Streptomyces sp. NPDC048479]|uniref:hypothetical protein n=1 Tax=Streptomyces sp. NPDC048479 TaxID=3154725 RepID=UPI0034387E3E
MSFDEEWASARADAPASVSMRLNQVDPGGGPTPEGDLRVDQGDLAAIGDEAFKLYQRLDMDGDHAKGSSSEAAASLKPDFALGAALSTVTDKWGDQVNTLLEACAHISNHLDYSKKAHAGNEYYIATGFKYSFADLEKGFEDGAQR